MQPVKPWIAIRPKFTSPRHKRGDVIGWICGDCGSKWYRHQPQAHKPGCPRALRNSLEGKTSVDYFKRPARSTERPLLTAARKSVLRMIYEHPNASSIEMTVRNRKNPNGWHCIASRDGGKVSYKQERFLMTTWARRHGYTDTR